MKRFTSIFLTLVMLFAVTPVNIFTAYAENTVFSDVEDKDYYAKEAVILEQLDILSGYPDGTFGADKFITRAEMVTVVVRMIDMEKHAQNAMGISIFDDVSKEHWASGYVVIASEEGIISGDGNGKFRPGDNVTYEEALKMIVCALGLDSNITVDPTDWSAAYIKAAQDNKITKKVRSSKGKLSTRGDVAVMVFQALRAVLYAPEASLASGSYKGEQEITLTTETEGADIYYTVNGDTPTVNSTKYKGSVTISDSCVLKAVAIKDEFIVSDIMRERYSIQSEKYRLTVDENGYGDVFVTQGAYKEDEKIQLKAVAAKGYEFERWYSDNGGSFSNKRDSECTFTMPDNDVVISASFTKIEKEEETSSKKETEKEENTTSVTRRVSYYDNSVIPKFESITGLSQVAVPISYQDSDADMTRYFYDATEEDKDKYVEYLLDNGWTVNGTSTGGDSRGKSQIIGFSYKTNDGSTIAQVSLCFFPDCDDLDLLTALKRKK